MLQPVLDLRLFGTLEVRDDATRIVPFESARAESLLAYLVVHRSAPIPRERLASSLWPDSTDSQARTNLRHLLHTLRRVLPASGRLIDANPRTVAWRANTPCWVDVAAFDRAIDQQDWAGAVAIYRGDLLDSCHDEWLVPHRDTYRQRYRRALRALIASLQAAGDYAHAIDYAARLQREDPLDEETYRLLIQLHTGRGDRAGALRVFHECAATLERELGVRPAPETRRACDAVLARTPTESGPPELAERTASPLVGRSVEWDGLIARWRSTANGIPHLVLLTGEAGIGKTRLAEEFAAWCVHRGGVVADARSYAAEGALTYAPVIEWLRSDPLRARWQRLDAASRAELWRLLPEFAPDVTSPPEDGWVRLSTDRRRLFEALASALANPRTPTLLTLDDVQWSDRETLQFLHYLLRQPAPLLVIATLRQEEIDGLSPQRELMTALHSLDRLTAVELRRLTREETAEIAEKLIGRALPPAAASALFAESEGNPLFVVEAIRAGWTAEGPRDRLPAKVQAAIDSRLARLSDPGRQMVAAAAVIGGDFTSGLLARVIGADESMALTGLDELWRRGIVRECGVDSYDFSHDKIREASYAALSPAQRRHGHLQAARALEQLHGVNPDNVSGRIASHYDRAGSVDEAVSWYQRAAEAAQRVYASHEAVRLLERARELLWSTTDSLDRRRRELAVLTELPAPLVAIEGYRSAGLTAIHDRALEVVRALAADPAPRLLVSLALAALSNFDFARAREYGERLRDAGDRDADPMIIAESEYILGIVTFWLGEFNQAKPHFERAIQSVRPEHRRDHVLKFGQDPESTCGMRLACTLCILGDTAGAVRGRDAAFVAAQEIGHPYNLEVTRIFAALLALEMRDPAAIREQVAQLKATDSDHRPAQVRVVLEAFDGYLDVLDRRVDGIVRIQRVLDDSATCERAPGQAVMIARILLEACAVAGDGLAGLDAADRALTTARGVAVWAAETRRLRAAFLRMGGAPADAIRGDLEDAIRIARTQDARLFEARALADLTSQ